MKARWGNILKILSSRERLIQGLAEPPRWKAEEEGGCGVTGFACSIPVAGRHIIEPSRQMNNRGNGKGGGIAAVGLCPEFPRKFWKRIICFKSPFSTRRLDPLWREVSSLLSWKSTIPSGCPLWATFGKWRVWR
jgi:hypothetical protein